MARALATGHGHTEEKDECGHLLTTQSVADGLVHGRATPVGACEMCRLVTPPPHPRCCIWPRPLGSYVCVSVLAVLGRHRATALASR